MLNYFKKKFIIYIFILTLCPSFLIAESLFHSPVPIDFWIHPGEGFCDEMYYHSYSGRTYHTAEDYIKKWKRSKVQEGEDSLDVLEKLQLEHYQYLPQNASFWNDIQQRKNFFKINLYRIGLDIYDTDLGLYPRTPTDDNYGYGENFYAIYDGVVVASVDIEKQIGWGKALLVLHKAPKGHVFSIPWKGKVLHLNEFWTQYSHNETHLVELHEEVKKGDVLGTIGDGNGIFHSMYGKPRLKEGAHLHFEIRIKNYPLFPSRQILTNKEELTEIYIQPSYFLKEAKLIKKKSIP